MRIIKSGYTFLPNMFSGQRALEYIERAGRICYKSETKITADSARAFVATIIRRGHHSVLEHVSFSVRFVCDRGISHEIVRHRLASYSQESTRYCNYGKAAFGNEITFIDPRPHLNDMMFNVWREAMQAAEERYFAMLEHGVKPQMARSVLPNSLKTELVMTANLREWRHFFMLRTAEAAHPQLVEITRPLLAEVRGWIPVVFDDVGLTDSDK